MTILDSHPGDRFRIKLEFTRSFTGTNTAEFTFKSKRSDLCDEPGEECFALAASIGVPVEFAGYREHGRDTHATLINAPNLPDIPQINQNRDRFSLLSGDPGLSSRGVGPGIREWMKRGSQPCVSGFTSRIGHL